MIHKKDNYLDWKPTRILYKVALGHQDPKEVGIGGPWLIHFFEVILVLLRIPCKFSSVSLSKTSKILLAPPLPQYCRGSCTPFCNMFIGLLKLQCWKLVTSSTDNNYNWPVFAKCCFKLDGDFAIFERIRAKFIPLV